MGHGRVMQSSGVKSYVESSRVKESHGRVM